MFVLRQCLRMYSNKLRKLGFWCMYVVCTYLLWTIQIGEIENMFEYIDLVLIFHFPEIHVRLMYTYIHVVSWENEKKNIVCVSKKKSH